MGPVWTVFCGESARQGSGDARTLHFNIGSRSSNVHLKSEDICLPTGRNLPPLLEDLLEIACYVFAADQGISRGHKADIGARWQRNIYFHIPVQCPEVWTRPEVLQELCGVLRFLSGENIDFNFTAKTVEKAIQQFLQFDQGPVDVQRVALFSGGLDSFSGAVQAGLGDNEELVLVTHFASTKRITKTRRLATEIGSKCSSLRHMTVECWSQAAKVEYTQRTRAFLFIALASTIARMLDQPGITLYENGVTSLNLPLSNQVVSTRASRTTHPQTIHRMERLLSLLFEENFSIETPFLWKTKSEIVDTTVEFEVGEMIAKTNSCSHTYGITAAHPHCGLCSQCLDRRLAILSRRLPDSNDPIAGYKVDPLLGARNSREARGIGESFLRRAVAFKKMEFDDAILNYPEIARAVQYVKGLDEEEAAIAIFELHQRNTEDALDGIDYGSASAHSALVRGDLPSSSVLSLAPAHLAGASRPVAHAESSFLKKGKGWEISFAGKTKSFPQKVALRHLSVLLRKPGTTIDAMTLQHGEQAPEHYEALQEAIDDDAKRDYVRQAQAIRQQLDDEWVTGEEEAKLKQELKDIEGALLANTGVSGKQRLLPSDRSRARDAVRKALRRQLVEFAEDFPQLYAHLKARLSFDAGFTYNCPDSTSWMV